jgi:hypothetical protein
MLRKELFLMAEVSSTSRPVTGTRKINEWLLFWSVIMIVFCIACTLLEVQTSELPILKGGGVRELVTPNLITFMQLVDLVQGRLTPVQFMAVIWGWGTQVVYNVCVLGWRHYHKAIAAHNEKLAVVCGMLAIGIAVYNTISNFNYAALLIQDFWMCLVLATLISLCSGTLGVAGVHTLKVSLGKE